jgi:hypothetical protein
MVETISSYIVLTAVVVLFGALAVLRISRLVANELTWASRIRQLLEREGFTVQRMERRWLTRGPFPDLRRPGTRNFREYLVRVIALDREHRRVAGWVRWQPPWPWTKHEQWAVQWDAEPWTAGVDGPTTNRGLSSRVFLPVVIGLSVLGAVAGIWILARGLLFQVR